MKFVRRRLSGLLEGTTKNSIVFAVAISKPDGELMYHDLTKLDLATEVFSTHESETWGSENLLHVIGDERRLSDNLRLGRFTCTCSCSPAPVLPSEYSAKSLAGGLICLSESVLSDSHTGICSCCGDDDSYQT